VGFPISSPLQSTITITNDYPALTRHRWIYASSLRTGKVELSAEYFHRAADRPKHSNKTPGPADRQSTLPCQSMHCVLAAYPNQLHRTLPAPSGTLGNFTLWLRLSLRLSLSLNLGLSTYLSQKVKWFR